MHARQVFCHEVHSSPVISFLGRAFLRVCSYKDTESERSREREKAGGGKGEGEGEGRRRKRRGRGGREEGGRGRQHPELFVPSFIF